MPPLLYVTVHNKRAHFQQKLNWK